MFGDESESLNEITSASYESTTSANDMQPLTDSNRVKVTKVQPGNLRLLSSKFEVNFFYYLFLYKYSVNIRFRVLTMIFARINYI